MNSKMKYGNYLEIVKYHNKTAKKPVVQTKNETTWLPHAEAHILVDPVTGEEFITIPAMDMKWIVIAIGLFGVCAPVIITLTLVLTMS